MFRNYLLVTFRNLYKNKVYALINILGLGMALAICIVAYFNHMFGYDFDRSHENFEEIYRVTSNRQMSDRDQEFGIVPAPLGPEVIKDLPAIKNSARLMGSYTPVKVGIENFNRRVSYVDPGFVDMFTFPMVEGSIQGINDPNNVLISEEMATALYGDEEAVSQPITVYNDDNIEFTYTVAGVFEDLPQNSSFRIDILTHIENFLTMWQAEDTNWNLFARSLFFQVSDPASLPLIQAGLDKYVPAQNKANESFTITSFNLIPLKEVNKRSRETWNNTLYPGLHPAAVLAPMMMALTMLLIAAFNFANTAIASAGKRLMEIGIRKVVGGERKQLMLQFLIENYIICFLALLVGIAGATILVPAYGSMWEYMNLTLSFSQYPTFWIFLVVLLLFTGFVAGVYPALYISSFRPLKILQSRTRLGKGGPLAKVLLGFQFTISVLSIVSGVIFSMNAVFQETVDLGYKRKELIVVPLQSQYFKPYYETITKHPKITQAAGTQEHIGFGWYPTRLEDENQEIEVQSLDVGPGYLQTMGLTVLEGRVFDPDREDADKGVSIVVNQKMVETFGWENPVDKQIRINDTIPLRIIGVVKDFYTNGMWTKIEPALMKLPRTDDYYSMAVRAGAEDLPEVLEYLRETWTTLVPNYPFEGMYQEDTLAEEKSINRSIKQLYIFLAMVATLLSMIGLYTLVSLSILNRTKEIGIRKVMGSPVPRIWLVLSKGFLANLLLSSAIGCVGGHFVSKMLLASIWENFLDFNAGIYIYSVLIILVITTATITGKIYQAALQNPAFCLRYE
ncbi:MAG: ABC transporter permease [Bacteroidales bacterium]|nr:ABC transporter permease [Bacteroidales bacterium]